MPPYSPEHKEEEANPKAKVEADTAMEDAQLEEEDDDDAGEADPIPPVVDLADYELAQAADAVE